MLVTTNAKKYITSNDAGSLLATLKVAKFESGETSVVLRVNGSYSAAMKVEKAARAEVVQLIDNGVDPSLSPDPAAARKRFEDDLEFLSTLKPALTE